MANEQAKFTVVLEDEVSDSAEAAASAVEELRSQMGSGVDSVKRMQAALRNLKGNTQAVADAKAKLKAQIAQTQNAVSSAQLKLLKHNEALKDTRQVAKDAAEQLKRNALGFDAMKGAMLGVLGVAAAIGAAVGGGIVAFGAWAIGAANAARSADLLREAATGSAENAYALGTQIDALALKVPTAKGALNELAVSLAKGGVEGQTLVDTLNAVGQASAALGDDAGGKLRALVDRGRSSRRFSVGSDQFSEDLVGTGLKRDDIASALSETMKTSVEKARQALAEGRVKLADGAEALRKAVEKKFGSVNLRKMLDLKTIVEKLHERLAELTAGIKLEPLLKAAEKLASLFSDTTVTGDALKQMISFLGNGLVKAVELSAPFVKKFLQGMIIAGLEVGIVFLQLRNRLRDAFGDVEVLKNVDVMNLALQTGKAAVYAMVAGLGLLAVTAAAAAAPFAALWGIFVGIPNAAADLGKQLRKTFLEIDWAATGQAAVEGFIDGFKVSALSAVETVKGFGESIKNAITDKLKIHSPSKVFEEYGQNTAAGFQRGVEGGTSGAAGAVQGLADDPPAARGGLGRGPVSISMPVTIQVSGGDAAKQLTDPAFLAKLTSALEQVLLSAGIPVST